MELPRSPSFGAVPEGSEFAARVYAALNARDCGAIKALSAPDIVVGTTVEACHGPRAPPEVAVGELPPAAITWSLATATRSRLSESAALRLRRRLDVRSM